MTETIWQDATVLITGGTGWLGRHILERLLEYTSVASVRIYSRDEHKQHDLRQRWSDTTPGSRVTYIVGDVRDRDRLTRAMEGVDVCLHTAALKRVEGSATHARELMKTNVLGTANVVDAAIDCGVRRTILTSSDKSCLATNCYGKTKALAEDLMIEGNAHGVRRGARFGCVRYGNVLLSTGSVLHLWHQAVERGEPLPLTHPQMTRFWITVDQAVDFVLCAVEELRGGEIFVPVMSHASMRTLAEASFPDYPIHVTAERAGGEKLAETVIGPDEARHATLTSLGGLPAYAIWPQQPIWDRDYQRRGEPLRSGFCLTSADDPVAADVPQMRALLAHAGWVPRHPD